MRIKPIVWIAFVGIFLTTCKTKIEGDTPYRDIVINEVMPKNSKHGSDQDGEFDDWIELFNLSDIDLDLSGVYLTDSKKNLKKWKFPDGTLIPRNGFLIVWADADTLQAGLHTNYKLSADGEKVLLVAPDLVIIDQVEYPATTEEKSYARIPNGTGKFQWSNPTFNRSND